MTGREIIARLHAGEFVYSTSIVSPSPFWLPFVKLIGIDFVFLDTEHVPQDRSTLGHMCQAYSAAGIPPVVRVPSNDPFEASKVLDAGAAGVIGPYLETADQARAMVGAVKWKPLKGARLAKALRDPTSMEPTLRTYLEERNGDKIFIANIESVPAIENLDEICSVAGVDAVLIGSHDLTCSLGIPEQYDHPRFDEAVRTIFRIAREHGVGAGIHCWFGNDRHIAWGKAGGNLVMHSSDLSAFSSTLKSGIQELRTGLEGTATPGTK
jgi:2-keto-3-deoxy-L-rhamnonate aldolase RhmA